MEIGEYFDIDDILASQQTVLCKLEVDVPKLGFLDTTNDSVDIKVGTKIDLPCWLAKNLSSRSRPVVSVELAKQYRTFYRSLLEQDVQIVNLPSNFSLYYYDFGVYMLNFAGAEQREIFQSLLNTFTSRFRMLMDKSNNVDVEEKLVHLDKCEKKIFASARKCAQNFFDWQTRRMEKLTPSNSALNGAKRKFDVID